MPELSKLFLGERGGNGVNEMDVGATDDGTAITAVDETGHFAPGGESGEAIFTAFYLTVTHTMAATLRIIPVLDGVKKTDQQKDVVLSGEAERTTKIIEVGLWEPVNDDLGAEVGRCAMRGTRIQCRIETVGGLAAGDLILDKVEVEHEVVLETIAVEQ